MKKSYKISISIVLSVLTIPLYYYFEFEAKDRGFESISEYINYSKSGFENKGDFDNTGFKNLDEYSEFKKLGFLKKSEFEKSGFGNIEQAKYLIQYGRNIDEAISRLKEISIKDFSECKRQGGSYYKNECESKKTVTYAIVKKHSSDGVNMDLVNNCEDLKSIRVNVDAENLGYSFWKDNDKKCVQIIAKIGKRNFSTPDIMVEKTLWAESDDSLMLRTNWNGNSTLRDIGVQNGFDNIEDFNKAKSLGLMTKSELDRHLSNLEKQREIEERKRATERETRDKIFNSLPVGKYFYPGSRSDENKLTREQAKVLCEKAYLSTSSLAVKGYFSVYGDAATRYLVYSGGTYPKAIRISWTKNNNCMVSFEISGMYQGSQYSKVYYTRGYAFDKGSDSSVYITGIDIFR